VIRQALSIRGMTFPRNAILTGVTAAVLVTGSLGCGAIRAAKNVGENLSTLGDFADKLEKSENLTYQAEYKLADASKVTVVQQPPAAAAIGDKGRFLATPDAFYFCDTGQAELTCNKTPNTDGSSYNTGAAALWGGVGTGFVSAPLAFVLLTGAVLVPTAKVEKSDTKIAGQKSDCVKVSNLGTAQNNDSMDDLESFTVCLSDSGVLTRFSGTSTGGETKSVELTKYSGKVDASLLEVPANAKIVDNGLLPTPSY
jgi:hypothetical protein